MTAAEDHVEKKGGKKKKKKKKKMDDDDEDLNAMLAALRAEYIGKVPPGEASKAEEAPKEDAKKIKTNGKETAEEKGDDKTRGVKRFNTSTLISLPKFTRLMAVN